MSRDSTSLASGAPDQHVLTNVATLRAGVYASRVWRLCAVVARCTPRKREVLANVSLHGECRFDGCWRVDGFASTFSRTWLRSARALHFASLETCATSDLREIDLSSRCTCTVGTFLGTSLLCGAGWNANLGDLGAAAAEAAEGGQASDERDAGRGLGDGCDVGDAYREREGCGGGSAVVRTTDEE
jgi:hypothetical protein